MQPPAQIDQSPMRGVGALQHKKIEADHYKLASLFL
jgi:hypothetical protein